MVPSFFKEEKAMLEKVITFDNSVKPDILDFFGKMVDDNGYIVEKGNASQKILTPDGDELKIEEFAGIKRGSEVFIKSDLMSLINLADKL